MSTERTPVTIADLAARNKIIADFVDEHHGEVRFDFCGQGQFTLTSHLAALLARVQGSELGRRIDEALVETAARKLSRVLYPSGNGSAEDEAWYWSSHFDHPGNTFEQECREQDRKVARAALGVAWAERDLIEVRGVSPVQQDQHQADKLHRDMAADPMIRAAGDVFSAYGSGPAQATINPRFTALMEAALNLGMSDGDARHYASEILATELRSAPTQPRKD